MDNHYREYVTRLWQKYFKKAALPITFYYVNEVSKKDQKDSKDTHRCLICNLNRVRNGHTFIFSANSPGCQGGLRYAGFSQKLRSEFEYFLSCGIPGKLEGERYKKSPELVRQFLVNHPPFKAPAQYLIFKRWDTLGEENQPLAVIFYATADVLSGLFTLANFDIAHSHGVIVPMGSGCSSIISYPLLEAQSQDPRCILGMFDVSARPCVPEHTLTFTIPFKRFEQIVENMDESFLITESWKQVRLRIKRNISE